MADVNLEDRTAIIEGTTETGLRALFHVGDNNAPRLLLVKEDYTGDYTSSVVPGPVYPVEQRHLPGSALISAGWRHGSPKHRLELAIVGDFFFRVFGSYYNKNRLVAFFFLFLAFCCLSLR